MKTQFKFFQSSWLQFLVLVFFLNSSNFLNAQIQPDGYEPYGFGPYMKSSNSTFPNMNTLLYAEAGTNTFYSGNIEMWGFEIIAWGSQGQIGYIESSTNSFKLSDVYFYNLNSNPNHYVLPAESYYIKVKTKRLGVWSGWGKQNTNITGGVNYAIKAVNCPYVFNSNSPSIACGGTFPNSRLTQVSYGGTVNSGQTPTPSNASFFPFQPIWRVTRMTDMITTQFIVPSAQGFVFAANASYNPFGIGVDVGEGYQFIKPNTTYRFEVGVKYPDNTVSFPSGTNLFGGCMFTTANYPANSARNQNQDYSFDVLTEKLFDAQAYPNPSTSSFTINVQSFGSERIDIVVYNKMGQLIASKILTDDFNSYDIGADFDKGFYTVIITQGNNIKKLKLIKQ